MATSSPSPLPSVPPSEPPTNLPGPFVRTQALISAGALRHNLQLLSDLAGVPLLLPMKAGAYGHGVRAVATVAAASDAVWGAAVATPAEALELAGVWHELGSRKPLVMFGPAFPDEWPALLERGVQLTVSTMAEAQALPAGARVHLKVNTGMNRLGARPAEAAAIARQLAGRGQLVSVYSHFSEAEEADQSLTRTQFAALQDIALQLRAEFPDVLYHISNSAGLLNLGPLPGMDLARPGVAAYGALPDPRLRPVMTLQASVTYLHTAQAGERVSYNGLSRLERSSLLATLPVGYADGYPRAVTGRADVWVAGERRPVLGRVCMDQTVIDVTGLDVKVGDPVTLWGEGPAPTVHDIHAWSGMSPYEIVTRVGPRVGRVLTG